MRALDHLPRGSPAVSACKSYRAAGQQNKLKKYFFFSSFLFTASSGPAGWQPAVRSHFNDCPDSHRQFCFHGTCRFLVQEDKPACVCHSGYVGTRCEHADLLAVVAANQKKQTITALVAVAVVASALLVAAWRPGALLPAAEAVPVVPGSPAVGRRSRVGS
ncbi:protransforming growth factor alpha [Falco biarmicus]|uniref:protransforming growth factor alpha n=1 Tax=Falco biarmicus TaxID=345155 RepID=UPI0024BD4355|nr:protransforming growth factor alpha [Falco biarmicus]